MIRNARTSASCGSSLAVCCVAVALACAVARAQRTDPLPSALEGVGITEHLGEMIPLDLEFTDEEGRRVSLADYFDGEHPVILTLNYYSCPMLCTLQLNGLIDALKRLAWTPGERFEIVTVSFDPAERPQLAKLKKQNYIREYGRPIAARGWHFLTGTKSNIEALTKTVGFTYRWDEESKQWLHAAAVYACTPTGKLSRYLYGVMYEPRDLRLALVEAGEGKTGSTLDQIILFCFHYDADAGRYAPIARRIMSLGGVLTVITLGTTLALLWVRDARRARKSVVEP